MIDAGGAHEALVVDGYRLRAGSEEVSYDTDEIGVVEHDIVGILLRVEGPGIVCQFDDDPRPLNRRETGQRSECPEFRAQGGEASLPPACFFRGDFDPAAEEGNLGLEIGPDALRVLHAVRQLRDLRRGPALRLRPRGPGSFGINAPRR
jgi:hypothetical protein